MLTLGEKIKEIRKKHNLNQSEFGELFGLTQNTITNIENDKRFPTYEILIEIAKRFNISVDYLLGLSEAKTNNIELKAICDYTGLTEEAVNKLHELCTSKEYDNTDNNILNDEDCTEENKKVISDFLISNEFEYIVSMACNLLLIDKIAFNYIDLFFVSLGNMDLLELKEKSVLQQHIKLLTNKNEQKNEALQDKCDLTLFKIQNAIISYFKKTTKILNQIENNNLVSTFDLLHSIVLYCMGGKKIDDYNFDFFKDFITKSYNSKNRKDDFAKLKEIYERYKDE